MKRLEEFMKKFSGIAEKTRKEFLAETKKWTLKMKVPDKFLLIFRNF